MNITEKLGITPGPWVRYNMKVRSGKLGIISRVVKGERYTDICESTFL